MFITSRVSNMTFIANTCWLLFISYQLNLASQNSIFHSSTQSGWGYKDEINVTMRQINPFTFVPMFQNSGDHRESSRFRVQMRAQSKPLNCITFSQKTIPSSRWGLEYADFPLQTASPQKKKKKKTELSCKWHWTASDGEAPVLEIWGMWSTPLLQLLTRALWPGVIIPVRFLSEGKIK